MVCAAELGSEHGGAVGGEERRAVSVVAVGDGEEGLLHLHRAPFLVSSVDILCAGKACLQRDSSTGLGEKKRKARAYPNAGRLKGGVAGEEVNGQASPYSGLIRVGTRAVPRWPTLHSFARVVRWCEGGV